MPLDSEKVGLTPEETKWIQDGRIGRALARFHDSRHTTGSSIALCCSILVNRSDRRPTQDTACLPPTNL